jgi:hypothetical protein
VIDLDFWKLGKVKISKPTATELIALALILVFLAIGILLWRFA